jgi:hypothetical protein
VCGRITGSISFFNHLRQHEANRVVFTVIVSFHKPILVREKGNVNSKLLKIRNNIHVASKNTFISLFIFVNKVGFRWPLHFRGFLYNAVVQKISLKSGGQIMKLYSKSLTVKFFFLCAIFATLNLNLLGYTVANMGETAFEEPSGTSSLSRSSSIESLIISGAAYFLDGNSTYLLFLNRIETTTDMANVNYVELKEILNNAIDKMTQAYSTYDMLVLKANSTPYKQSFIDKLTDLNYTSFAKGRGVTGSCWDDCAALLENGNVRGVFTRLSDNTAIILDRLNMIKGSLDANQFPDLGQMWRLNQLYSETMLFGQYSAEIFYEVSGK